VGRPPIAVIAARLAYRNPSSRGSFFAIIVNAALNLISIGLSGIRL